MEAPVEQIVTLAEEGIDMRQRETGQMVRFAGIPFKGRSNDGDEDESNNSDIKLGCKPCGEKGSSRRVQSYAVWHDREGRRRLLELSG